MKDDNRILDKFEKEMDLLQTDIDGRKEQIKHMKAGRQHINFTKVTMVLEIMLLAIIAYKLL